MLSPARRAAPLSPSLSKAQIPVIDTTYVAPLLTFDAVRLSYVDILAYDWAKAGSTLAELEVLFAMVRSERSTWDHVKAYPGDLSRSHALQRTRRTVESVPKFQGWNRTVDALCDTCWSLRATNDRLKSEALAGHDAARIIKVATKEFERGLASALGDVKRLLGFVNMELDTMAGLVEDLKDTNAGYSWNPSWSWSRSRSLPTITIWKPNTWTDIFGLVTEHAIENLTAPQEQRRAEVTAWEAEDFELRVRTAHSRLHRTAQELYKLWDQVKGMASNFPQDANVSPSTTMNGSSTQTADENCRRI